MASAMLPEHDVAGVDSEVLGPGGTFTGNQDLMIADRTCEKHSSTDESPIVGSG